MIFNKKSEKSSEEFWLGFEKETGEKVLKRGLGKYISGWDEFDKNKWNGIWGLVITTSGGFRFHHFPQYTWIDSFTRFAEKSQPSEKTIFIPNEKIILTEIKKETKWWKKIFFPSVPQIIIRYSDDMALENNEKQLVFEAEYN